MIYPTTISSKELGFSWLSATADNALIVDAIKPASTTPSITGSRFSLDNSHDIYYVLSEGNGSARFRWGYGQDIPQALVPSWTVSDAFVPTNHATVNYPYIYASSPSNVWVAVSTYDGTNYHIEVWHYGGSSWSNLDDINTGSSQDAAAISYLGSTDYIVTYGSVASTGSALSLISTSNGGTSWSSATTTTSTYVILDGNTYSQGSTLDFAGDYVSGGMNGVTYWSCSFPCSSAPTETVLHAASSASTWAANVGGNGTAGNLVTAYTLTGSNPIYVRFSTNAGGLWSPEATGSSNYVMLGSALSITQNTGLAGNDQLGIIFLSGASSPY